MSTAGVHAATLPPPSRSTALSVTNSPESKHQKIKSQTLPAVDVPSSASTSSSSSVTFPKTPDEYPPHAVEWKPDMYTGHLNPCLVFPKAPVTMAGILMVRVKVAQYLFKTHNFGKPDPYIEVKVGEESRKTGIAPGKDRGSVPRWDTMLQFSLKGNERRLTIIAWNRRTLGDDMIGKAIVSLNWLLQLSRPSCTDEKRMADDSAPRDDGHDPFHEGWFALGRDKYQRSPAGQVLLSVCFYPTQGTPAAPPPEKKKHNPKYRTQPEELLEDIRKGYNLHPPKKWKGQGLKIPIFGGELKNAIALSKYKVPKVVHDTIKFLRQTALKEEGLFRVPGNNEEIHRLKKSYDAHIDVGFSNPHDAAGVLKLYLRELPEPLIPFSHYEHFLNVDQIPEPAKRMEQYRVLISSIPPENRETLRYLFEFLLEVSTHSEVNKMDLANLAIVFAPNILRPKVDTTSSVMSDMSRTLHTMQTLIKEHTDLFPKSIEKKTDTIEDPEKRVEKDAVEIHQMEQLEQLELAEMIKHLQEQVAYLESKLTSAGIPFERSGGSLGPSGSSTPISDQHFALSRHAAFSVDSAPTRHAALSVDSLSLSSSHSGRTAIRSPAFLGVGVTPIPPSTIPPPDDDPMPIPIPPDEPYEPEEVVVPVKPQTSPSKPPPPISTASPPAPPGRRPISPSGSSSSATASTFATFPTSPASSSTTAPVTTSTGAVPPKHVPPPRPVAGVFPTPPTSPPPIAPVGAFPPPLPIGASPPPLPVGVHPPHTTPPIPPAPVGARPPAGMPPPLLSSLHKS